MRDGMKERIGLLVMDYGTPTAEADLMPYYTSIRRGYAPTEAEVAVLKKRYEAIGGLSPLGALTEGQAELLAKQLNEHSDDVSYELYIVYIFRPLKFKNEKERREYYRLVRNVKKTLPLAREINRAVIETYEYIETLPDKKAREKHLKLVEKGLKRAIYTDYEEINLFTG